MWVAEHMCCIYVFVGVCAYSQWWAQLSLYELIFGYGVVFLLKKTLKIDSQSSKFNMLYLSKQLSDNV